MFIRLEFSLVGCPSARFDSLCFCENSHKSLLVLRLNCFNLRLTLWMGSTSYLIFHYYQWLCRCNCAIVYSSSRMHVSIQLLSCHTNKPVDWLGQVTSWSGYAGERLSVLAAQNRGEWSGLCPWRDNDIRPFSRQVRCQRLCDVLLLASSAQKGPTFTRCGVRGYAGPRFCDVTCGLLQRHSRWGIQVYHRQAPASYECCCSRHQRFTEVWS